MAFSRLRRLGKFSLLAGIGLMAQAALAGTLTNVSVTPADSAPGATTTYTFTYTLEQDVNADEALLYVTFPPGFAVASGACDRVASITLNPVPMGGTAICRKSYGSGNTVGLAVNASVGGGVSVPGGTEVEIVVGGVTNPTAGNYSFDNGSGTGIITTQMMDPMFPMVMEKDISDPLTVTIGTVTPVNGACGVASGGVVDVSRLPPSSELCAVDVEFAYAEDATRAYWGCKGKNGGTDTAANACSATKGHVLIAAAFPPSSGTANCSPNPVAAGGNSVCTPTPAPGYTFDKWSGDCVGAVCAPNNVTNIWYMDAEFVVSQYPITTLANPSTAGSVSCSSNPVTHGSNTTCTYTANPGYTFTNWSGDCTGATCALTTVNGAKSVTANFTAPTFTVTVNTSGSGTASCTPNPVSEGSNSTCTASPNAGNTFTGWSGDCAGGSCVLTNVTANKTVTATFAPATYSISGSASPVAGGSVSCSSNISHGGNGSCSAAGNTGYTFTGWSGCPSASGTTCNFSGVTSNQSVTANFTINSYTVSATASPIDAGSASCTSPVVYGSASSCTAKAAAGYRFSGWSGACSGSTCTLASVTANTSVTASFELLPSYNIATQVTPANSGTISCTKDILEGGTGTCTVKANAGFRFASWGGDCSGTDTSCKVENVTSAKSVSATFETATSFKISGRQQFVGGSSYLLLLPGELPEIIVPFRVMNCSQSNPISINSTVSCHVASPTSWIGTEPTYRGWSGDCTRVEGHNCIIENITSDKHIIAHYGFNLTDRPIKTQPAGAGSVWCGTSFDENVGGIRADEVRQRCVAEANPGYVFTSFTEEYSFLYRTTTANFTKQANTPVVTCTNCSNSTLSTDTTNTKSVSKTSEPNEQGNSTQATVATTTTTGTGSASTSVRVSNQNASGATQSGTTVTTNNPNAEFSVTNSNEATGTLNNPATGETTNVVATTSTTNTTVMKDGQKVSEVSTSSGQTAAVNTTSSGTTVAVTDTATGKTLGTTTVSGSTTTTATSGDASADGSTLVRNAARGDSAAISTFYGAGTVISTSLFGSSSVTTTQGFGSGSGLGSSVSMGIASTQTASLISGAIGGGFVSAGTGGFAPSTGSGGGFSGSSVSAQVKAPGASSNQKPGLQKAAAVDDNAQAAIDITGGTLQSVQLYSDNTGLVEFFKPGTDAGSPQMTAFESTDDAFSITLSYPAKK